VHAIQEHKLDHHKYAVRAAFLTATKQIHRKQRVELGSSAMKTITTYKPGGTALLAQGDITGRIQTHESDPYGWWSYMTFNGAPGTSITIISAYQVFSKPMNQSGITAYHQQATAFQQEKRKKSKPKVQFQTRPHQIHSPPTTQRHTHNTSMNTLPAKKPPTSSISGRENTPQGTNPTHIYVHTRASIMHSSAQHWNHQSQRLGMRHFTTRPLLTTEASSWTLTQNNYLATHTTCLRPLPNAF
jgi:hypothetical protein